jgi:hypothetical protein
VAVKSSIFWDIILCNPLKANQHFGGTCHLHLQGQRLSQARNQRERKWQAELFHTDLLRGLFFDPEDGGDMFLRNTG